MSNTSNSDKYLTQQLLMLTTVDAKKSFRRAYNFKRIKRFLISTVSVFFLQYLTLIHLSNIYSGLPLYPPIGSALVMIYLLGDSTLLGLFLGSFCAYCVHGFTLPSLFLYISADLGGAYLGARWCQMIFTSDQSIFVARKEWLRFAIYVSLICFFSGLLRMLVILVHDTNHMPVETVGYYFLNLWIADLNAIIVFTGFFLTWISVYLGRERVFRQKSTTLSKICWLLWGLSCLAFLKKIEFLLLAILLSLYLSYCFGILIATAVSYALTTLFLICFTFNQASWLHHLGQSMYILIPCSVLSFLFAMLRAAWIREPNP